jgi:hypothetical protein
VLPKKKKTKTRKTQKTNILIPKGKNGGPERKDGTKAKLKPSRANIKSCSFRMSSSWGTRWVS